MGILAPISVIDSANINKLGPLLATEWIALHESGVVGHASLYVTLRWERQESVYMLFPAVLWYRERMEVAKDSVQGVFDSWAAEYLT
jgi:hypothetical protein